MDSGLKLEEKTKVAEEALRQMLQENKGNPEQKASPEETSIPEEKTELPKEEKVADKEEETEEISEIDESEETRESQEAEKKDAAYWKRRFEVLQGKEYAEVPRLAAENKELKSQLSELKTQIDDLQPKVTGKDESVKTDNLDKAISLIETELGKDIGNALNNLVESKTKDISKAYENKIQKLEEKISHTEKNTQSSRAERYVEKLIELVPDWEEKNKNKSWIKWLYDIEPCTGKTYQELLDSANNACDAKRVANIFNLCPAFKDNGNSKPNIKEIVEPGKPKMKKISTENENEKYYSQKEIDQFNRDVLRGKYANEEKLRIEKEAKYSKAIFEGRVI